MDIKRVLLSVSVWHHCSILFAKADHVLLCNLTWRLRVVCQKSIPTYRSWVRLPLSIYWDSSVVRTIDLDVTGSNPVRNSGLR